MKQWFHPKCLFETFERARATTKIVDSSDEVDGFTDLNDEDKDLIKSLINDIAEKRANKGSKSAAKKPAAKGPPKSESKSPSVSKPVAAKAAKTASPAKSSPAKSSPAKVINELVILLTLLPKGTVDGLLGARQYVLICFHSKFNL